jgi:hypothetical protein
MRREMEGKVYTWTRWARERDACMHESEYYGERDEANIHIINIVRLYFGFV